MIELEVLNNFVVLEGIDGAGTTSQLELLQTKVFDCGVAGNFNFTFEPTDRKTGFFLRQCLSGEVKLHAGTLARLFAADRAEHLYGASGIVEMLNRGKVVVTDRYLFSSLAYQSADGQGKEAQKANEDFPLPQYLFYFDIDVNTAFARIAKRGSDREIYERAEFQDRVLSEYERILKYYENTGMEIIRLDASESFEKIHEKIWSVVGKLPITY